MGFELGQEILKPESPDRWRETGYLITGNTLEAVKRSVCLARRGERVLLAVEETFLAADIGSYLDYESSPELQGFFPDSLWRTAVCIRMDIKSIWSGYAASREQNSATGCILWTRFLRRRRKLK